MPKGDSTCSHQDDISNSRLRPATKASIATYSDSLQQTGDMDVDTFGHKIRSSPFFSQFKDSSQSLAQMSGQVEKQSRGVAGHPSMCRSLDNRMLANRTNQTSNIFSSRILNGHDLSASTVRLASTSQKLLQAEERLHKELVNKTRLESNILDLMSEVAELRALLQSVEDERDTYRSKYNALQNELLELNERLSEKDKELESVRNQINNNGKTSNGSHHLHHALAEEGEYEALKKAINDLLAENDEKDLKIDELRKAIMTYQKVEEIILSSSSHRARSEDTETCRSTSTTPNHDRKCSVSPMSRPNQFSPVTAPPVPKHATVSVQRSNSYDASKFNRIIMNDCPDDDRDASLPVATASSFNLEQWSRESRQKGSCTSLPRDYGNRLDMSMLLSPPNKNETIDSDVFTDDEDALRERKKKRGLKRFFARMRRSTSQEAVDDKPFKRGGVRATAGGRLGGGNGRRNPSQLLKSDSFLGPFARWTSDQVITWLHDLGLSMYANDCRKWCRSGQHILEASKHELEKELRIHHPLHKKKLLLAIESIRAGDKREQFMLNGLRADWIAKWLDDIGLPQYKDQFYDARIDGRMLNNLTVDDLLYMKINNAMHHLSIRRGIEVLRAHNFNLGTLKRRPSLENTSQFLSSTLTGCETRQDNSERDVSLWTNHRVMEWLRMIDLSEYAANLRGSGVHGALIMLEPRFTVEHLADILIIPQHKTLLRRHLSAHFVNLVGQKTQARKREIEQIPGMALTLNMKVKSKRSNPFRRGRPVSAYICPMEKIEPIDISAKAEDRRIKSAVALYKKELGKRDTSKKDNKPPAK